MSRFATQVIRMAAIVSLSWVAVGEVASAQEANCADPQSNLEMKICAGQAYRAADGDLNADYLMARDAMRQMDKDLPKELRGAEKALLKGQRAWIKYRDGACDAEGFTVRGGTMESLIVTSCLARLTRQRSEDLRTLFEEN